MLFCFSIFILYKNFKVADFNQRLVNEVKTLDKELRVTSLYDSLALTYTLNSNNLVDEKVTIVNGNKIPIINLPVGSLESFTNNDSLLKIIKEKKLRTFKIGERDVVAQYNYEHDNYIFVSAIDKVGFRKLQNLVFILLIVFFITLFVSIIITFYFISKVLQPLINLSNQIENTTFLNLTKQVDEGKGNDEINNIAKNFNAMLQRLNNAFENQKTFVQNASHELRTPLATMLSQTEAAINRNLDKEGYKKILLSLKEEQTNIIELINSLLLISQYDKIVFQDSWPKERVDEVLYDTIATCKRQFRHIDISLDFKTLPEIEEDLLVACNDTLLKSAFKNLIKNAYNYSNNQKVTIVIEIVKPVIKVIFTNTGNQLSSAEIDKIKMPFFRGQNAVNKKGFGLGLSIVNKIIELHNGSIKYKALDDNINQFSIILPIAKY
jgi:signal transduction histidine kinase